MKSRKPRIPKPKFPVGSIVNYFTTERGKTILQACLIVAQNYEPGRIVDYGEGLPPGWEEYDLKVLFRGWEYEVEIWDYTTNSLKRIVDCEGLFSPIDRPLPFAAERRELLTFDRTT